MKESLKILTLSVNAWNDTYCTGNTFSNFLGRFSEDNIANIFCRNEVPSNNICKLYFKITENDILLNLVDKKHKAGYIYTYKRDISNGTNIYNFFKHIRPTFFLFIRELLWSFGTWKNNDLDNFLLDFKPDIIYMHGHLGYYMHKLLWYCKKKTNAKIVLFFGDDMYSYKSYNPIKNIYHFFMRKYLKKSIDMASLIYGGSEPLCIEYSELFHRRFNLLYKGLDFANNKIIDKNQNKIINITYAGNLLYGRWITLAYLAKEIKEINKNSIKAKLNIYTQTPINKRINEALNIPNASEILGKIPYNEVKEKLFMSDIVIHVESFLPHEIKKTRLSFSTKIMDCIQSESCVLAIGPQDVASIKYLQSIDSAIVITDLKDIKMLLNKIIENPQLIIDAKMGIYNFSKEYQSIQSVQLQVYNDINSL
jgi:hypothetical protein